MSERPKLFKREEDALIAIREFHQTNDKYPTIQELMLALDVSSTSTVSRYLTRLTEKGYIHREPYKARSMRIIHDEPPK